MIIELVVIMLQMLINKTMCITLCLMSNQDLEACFTVLQYCLTIILSLVLKFSIVSAIMALNIMVSQSYRNITQLYLKNVNIKTSNIIK